MPPKPHKRPKREDVQKRLLEAAMQEFKKVGYERASVDRVAARAGFSKGAIYSNFKNKEQMFLTLMDNHVRERIAESEQLIAKTVRNGKTDTKAVLERIAALLESDNEWRLLFLEYAVLVARSAKPSDVVAEQRRQVWSLVAGVCQTLLGSDHPLWDEWAPQEIALLLLSITNGLEIEGYVNQGNGDQPSLESVLNKTLNSLLT